MQKTTCANTVTIVIFFAHKNYSFSDAYIFHALNSLLQLNKMKWSPGALFCEQVGELTRVFSQWNECEQTVVLYALLRRIPAVQARFLAQAVQHSLHSVSELDTQELNANNSGMKVKNFLLVSLDITKSNLE